MRRMPFALQISLWCSAALFPFYAVASGEEDKNNFRSPLAKRGFLMSVNQTAAFEWSGLKYNDFNSGGEDVYEVDLFVRYFLANGFGVGLGLDKEGVNSVNAVGAKSTYGRSLGRLSLLYGRDLSGRISLYGEVAYGLGKGKYSHNDGDDKFDLNRVAFEAGALARVGDSRDVFAAPRIGWQRSSTEFGNVDQKQSEFFFRADLTASFDCAGFGKPSLSPEERYRQGTRYIGGSLAKLGLGSTVDEFANSTEENMFRHGAVLFDYRHFIFDRFSVGAIVNYDYSSSTDKTTQAKNTTSGWMVEPRVVYQAPLQGAGGNTFLGAGVGFGGEQTVGRANGASGRQTSSLFSLKFFTGYNLFLTNALAVSPTLEYHFRSVRNSAADLQSRTSGLELKAQFQLLF